mmetsp:Transcript_24220/g.27450  ORF Transcript_24220/g.27450 Transcript_24220/m.27450 type:complete len:777 (+) Transcript_24220:436-2766(+)
MDISGAVRLITASGEDSSSRPVERSIDGRFVRYADSLSSNQNKSEYRGYDTQKGCEISWVVVKLDHIAQNMRKRYLEELKLITKLDHENIIHCLDAWHSPNKNEIVFVRELILGGNLRSYLQKFKRPKLSVIKRWSQSVLNGLSYLHGLNLIHRDIRCDNVFINGSTGEIRIGDLSYVTSITSSHASSHVGKPEYMPPEVVDGRITHAIDIYCVGMMIMEIVTGEKPYRECSSPAHIYRKLLEKVSPVVIDRILDENVKNFIKRCINPEHEQRPNSDELLGDPFFVDIDDASNKQYVELGPEIDYDALKNREKKGGETRPKKHHAEEDITQGLPREEDSSFKTADTKLDDSADHTNGPSDLSPRVPSRLNHLVDIPKKVKISLQVTDNNEKHHEVSFDFDLGNDTPEGVATEMVEDLDLPESQYTEIVRTIRKVLTETLNGSAPSSGTGAGTGNSGLRSILLSNPGDNNGAINPGISTPKSPNSTGIYSRLSRQNSRVGDSSHKRPLEDSPFRKTHPITSGGPYHGDPDMEEAEKEYRIQYQKLTERHKSELQISKERHMKALEELFLTNLMEKFEAGTLLHSTTMTISVRDDPSGTSPSRSNHHSHHHGPRRHSGKALVTTGKLTQAMKHHEGAHKNMLSTHTLPSDNLIEFSPLTKQHRADDDIQDSAEMARKEAMLPATESMLKAHGENGENLSHLPRHVSEMNLPAMEKYYENHKGVDDSPKDISLLDMDVSKLKRKLSPVHDGVAAEDDEVKVDVGVEKKPEVSDLLEMEN